nr:hypothetical protein [uncultured Chitinophaga sp.]
MAQHRVFQRIHAFFRYLQRVRIALQHGVLRFHKVSDIFNSGNLPLSEFFQYLAPQPQLDSSSLQFIAPGVVVGVPLQAYISCL